MRDALRKTRAWRRLQAQGRDVEHYRLFQDIPKSSDIGFPDHAFLGLVPPEFRAEAKICLRQSMYDPARDSGLWAELICHLAGDSRPITLSAPPAWRDALEARGVPTSSLRSAFGFLRLQIKAMKASLGTLRRLLKRPCAGQDRGAPMPHVVFSGVRDHYLPLIGNRTDTRWDLISWYRRSNLWDPRTKEIRVTSFDDLSVADMTGIRQVSHTLPDLSDSARRGFIFQALLMTAWAGLRWLTGAWWMPFLLGQSLQLAYARRVPSDQLPMQACFNSTQKTVRPLWSYDAERRGTRVMIILYSKNVSVFIPGNPGVPETAPDFAQVSWPEFVIWDECHKKELIMTGVDPTARFTMMGPIGFADSAEDFSPPPQPSVAVFDVDAVPTTYGALRGFARPYWTHDNALAFVEASFRAIRAVGAVPVYKPKGYLGGRLLRPRASVFLDLVKDYDAILLDGMINANRVITATDASISMPFTSTAASGAYLDRPAVYYDPTAGLHAHLSLAGDVPVLFNQAELEDWLRTSLSTMPTKRGQ